ncbi:hypothetical protein TraAM80_07995 [Trypanosoma rangeli]|uniref:Uncharacterized protein n=1 Tax=Trypanosoma rangeli TaxID=5698 RepID=A0A3R7M5J1_TRYRA|nr:uncharacterized protein TraAM80_07995 [Trypanosoma rangeli]RNE99803.1 hypothetical protein TraAM80_07995 [Trypanosoma rangeli]|eukprot:RNE99803.1 hypothetical protein TraAM80_07995 [Trypanosoma rangeli]
MQKRGGIPPSRNSQGVGGAAEDIDDSQLYTSAELFPYLSVEDRSNLSKEVVAAINNELVHHENLEVTVPHLVRSCANEAKELRRAINSMASSQMLEGHRAVQIVRECGERIQDLRKLFMKQGDLITGMEVTSGSYTQLRQLHFLRENILSVIQWAEALKEVQYTNFYALVEQRRFAAVYKHLRRLQLIRQTVSEKTSSKYHSAFEPYFEKLDAVQTVFVSEVYKLLEESSVHVAIQMALEDIPGAGTVAETFPEFTQLEECVQVCGEEIGGGEGGVSTGVLCTVDGEPLITEEKVYRAVRKCVTRLWEEQVMVDVVDPFGQISTYLEQMKKVAPLLGALEMSLIPLSTKLSFFATVVGAIHSEVMGVLQGYVDPAVEVEATGLLEALHFIQWYKAAMTEANYAAYIELDAIDSLSAAMMTSAIEGLSAHLVRLCRACAMSIRDGRSEPLTLPNGLPVTAGPVDMFAVLQQSLGGLSTAIEVPVMRKIGVACAEAIKAYLEECKMHSDYDYWEEENDTAGIPVEEWTMHRLVFLYAFCNDCSTIERNMDTIELKFASYWDEEEGGEHSSPFQQTQDLISEHVLFYVDEIVLHVERVVNAQWNLVFRSKEWYDSNANPTEVIIDTIGDFIDEEFTKALEESRMRMAVRSMLTRYVHKYLTTLMEFLGEVIRHQSTRSVEDWNGFVDCFSRDTVLAMKMWGERVKEGNGKLVNAARRVLELIMHLLSVKKPVDFNFLVQKDLLDEFGDCPSFVVRFILKARQKELDTETRDTMLSLWNECVAHQQRGADDVPTVGWSQAPSFLGALDRSMAELDKRGSFFRKSAQQRRVKAEQMRREAEKQNKREERRARREINAAAAKVRAPLKPPRLSLTDEKVEVANLADLLK